MIARKPSTRRGVAAVEMALVTMLFIAPMMIAVWELGRLIEVQQIVSSSAREGARVAAQGFTVNSTGSPTQIKVSSGYPNVTDTVYTYLTSAGLSNLQKSDITVTFAFTTARTTDYIPSSSDPVGTSYPAGSYPPEPCYGEKNEKFTVTVKINDWGKVRWVNLGLIRPTDVQFTVTWQMLTDDAFTVNTTLPTW